ncbi:MAG: hypothetical protein K2N43_02065, partial [Lachnospiraceae bacterium]|nr:hypothetical protein [Lachnospiraceae bacterium]
MKKQKLFLFITSVTIACSSLPVQASLPIPDFLPMGQVDLDGASSQGDEGQAAGNDVEGDNAEEAQEVLQEEAVGSGVI